MGIHVTFRTATTQDARLIQTFQLAMAWETENLKLDQDALSAGVNAVFKNPNLGTYHVCVFENQIVGCLLIVREWSDWRNGFVWWIHSLYFSPEHRGQGLFSKMYSYIQDLVRTDPMARGLRLYVDRTNLKAQEIYRKIGMSDDHYQMFEWMK